MHEMQGADALSRPGEGRPAATEFLAEQSALRGIYDHAEAERDCDEEAVAAYQSGGKRLLRAEV
jgi:hypothetical protein